MVHVWLVHAPGSDIILVDLIPCLSLREKIVVDAAPFRTITLIRGRDIFGCCCMLSPAGFPVHFSLSTGHLSKLIADV